MIRSMTGFGQAAGLVSGREVNLEIRAVNHRFRDIVCRLPKRYAALEDQIKKVIAARIARGRLEVSLQVADPAGRENALKLDMKLARIYYGLLIKLREEFLLNESISLSDLIGFRDIIVFEEEPIDLEAFMTELSPVLDQALDRLMEMRRTEGRTIAQDFTARLEKISRWVDQIAAQRQTVINEARVKLEERIKALVQNIELDQGRLLQEVAYLVDRSDVTEETVRVKSHLDQFRSLLQSEAETGRRLDFLLQEINREVNTIGSKSGNVTITNLVVDLKTELEKLREQIQNIE